MDEQDFNAQLLLIKQEADPIRKANLFIDVHEKHSISYSIIAQRLGVSPTYISNFLRLLRLPPLVLDGYYTGSISLTHLFIMSRVKDPDRIVQLYEDTLSRNLSALALEEEVRAFLYGTSTEGEPADARIKETIVKRFTAQFPGAAVKIIQTRIKAKVVFEVKGNRSKTSEFLRRLSEE